MKDSPMKIEVIVAFAVVHGLPVVFLGKEDEQLRADIVLVNVDGLIDLSKVDYDYWTQNPQALDLDLGCLEHKMVEGFSGHGSFTDMSVKQLKALSGVFE